MLLLILMQHTVYNLLLCRRKKDWWIFFINCNKGREMSQETKSNDKILTVAVEIFFYRSSKIYL